jgi:hypothetical protein
MKKTTEELLVTAGNRIICKRCAAKSKRSGLRCGRPAMRGKAVCNFHGGRSTGPKTDTGKARQAAAVTTSGRYTKEAIEGRRRSSFTLAGLEDAMYVLKMTNTPRTRGRKPLGYVKLQTVEDVVMFALDNPLHLPGRPDEDQN